MCMPMGHFDNDIIDILHRKVFDARGVSFTGEFKNHSQLISKSEIVSILQRVPENITVHLGVASRLPRTSRLHHCVQSRVTLDLLKSTAVAPSPALELPVDCLSYMQSALVPRHGNLMTSSGYHFKWWCGSEHDADEACRVTSLYRAVESGKGNLRSWLTYRLHRKEYNMRGQVHE